MKRIRVVVCWLVAVMLAFEIGIIEFKNVSVYAKAPVIMERKQIELNIIKDITKITHTKQRINVIAAKGIKILKNHIRQRIKK